MRSEQRENKGGKRMMRHSSLQKRIFAFYSLLMVVLSLIILGITYNVYNDILIEKIAQSRVDVLKQVAERTALMKNTMTHVSNTFYTNSNITDFIKSSEMTAESEKKFEEVAEEICSRTNAVFQSKEFEFTVAVYADNGLAYSTFAPSTDYGFSDVKDELWYKEVLDKEHEINWISGVQKVGDQKISTVSAVRLIHDENGEIRGAIIIHMKEEFLKATYENMMNEDNDIYIVAESGKIVSNRNEKMLGLKYFNMERLDSMVNEMSFAIVKNSEGRRLLTAYDDSELGWVIVELIKTQNIYGEVRKVTYLICGLILLAVGFAVILSYYFAKKTVAPLRVFEKDIEKVRKGDMHVISTVQGWQEMSEIRDAFNKMIEEIQELMDGIKRKEKEKHQIELEFLQAQINPHFLYNTLFSIKCLIGMNENTEAQNMISDFIGLLRMVLNKEGNFILLEKELEYTKKYVNIQKYRYGEKFDFYIECNEACKKAEIPKLILQPIVENAIFHGIESKEGSGVIVISVSRAENDLVISVSDDGIGMSEEKIGEVLAGHQERTSREFSMVGIYNIQQRINLYYGMNYRVTVTSKKNCGTTVTIRIPYKIMEGGETE